ncbi:MAG: hypothetical protein JSU63_16075 [Phycisphaerales bacterium]|nr:MAG: hypothetical protein JSU63_16075 [Phycisphaerales bacterium]
MIRLPIRCVPPALVLGILSVGFATGAGNDDAEPPTRQSAALHVRLTPIEGFDDEAAYARSIAARAGELVMQAQQNPDVLTQTDLLLAAANLILAFEVEPLCAAKLLGFPDEQLPLSAKQVGDALDRADAIILQTETTLSGIKGLEDAPAQWLTESSHRADTLTAFAKALRAFLQPEIGQEAGRRAAAGLSVFREDANPQVGAAASLWQACLRARESDTSRAMTALDLALSDPRRNTMPFAFFARLLRCQLVSSRGGHVAALAILTQIEDRCSIWVSGEKNRDDAARAVTFVEIQTLKDWLASGTQDSDSSQQEWCANRIQTLVQERFAGGSDTVLRLSTAVPIIAPVEDAGRQSLHSPTSQD